MMKKIGFITLRSNLASANLAMKMHGEIIPGAPYFIEKLEKLSEACKPDNSVAVGFLVLNAYVWGQEYQRSLVNQEKR